MGGIPDSGLLDLGIWSKGAEGDLELWSAIALRRNGLVPDMAKDRGEGLHEK